MAAQPNNSVTFPLSLTSLTGIGAGLSLHVNVRDTGARANYQAVTDGVMAAGSAILTSASGRFAPTDVGKLIWVAPTDRSTAPRAVSDGAIASGSNSLTSATAAFVAADVGSWVSVAGAGIFATALVARIVAVRNGTTVLLNINAQTTVARGSVVNIFSLGTSSNVPQRTANDAAATASHFTVTSTAAAFTQADIGRFVTISGAGIAGAAQTNQIVAVSGNVATLGAHIVKTVSGATITLYGVRSVADAGIAANQVTLTSATAAFVTADIGGFVTIGGAGHAGAALVTQIVYVINAMTAVVATPASTTVAAASLTVAPPGALAGTITRYLSPRQVTLSDAASIACSSSSVGWATDDTAAIQAAFNAVATGGEVIFPPGIYTMARAGFANVYGTSNYCLLLTTSGVSIHGYGATLLLAGGTPRSTTGVFIGDNVNPTEHVTVAGLSFDGNAKAGKNPISTLGNNAYITPSQLGCAPIWASDDFQALLNIRGPYTSHLSYPKVGQGFTRYIQLRDLGFYRCSAAGLVTVCYVENVSVTHSVFDGQGIWSCVCHLDGLANGYIAGNLLKDIVPAYSASGWLLFAFNGDTGYRPCRNTTIIGNVIKNTLSSASNYVGGGKSGIAGVLQYCSIVDNVIEGMSLYGIDLGLYASATTGFYAGSTHNTVDNNRLLNNCYGLIVGGAPGATKSGNANLSPGSTALTGWTGTPFVNPTDIGCWISIAGAGAGGSPLITQIVAVGSGTTCTLAAANQSGNVLTAVATVAGGQNGQNSNQNVISNNSISNDGTTKYGGDYKGGAYHILNWTRCAVGFHVASGSAAPVGGNTFVGNRLESMWNLVIDLSIGTGLTGVSGAPTVYDQYINNDFGADSQFTRAHVQIASPYVRLTSLKGGLLIGQQANNGSNVHSTPIRHHQSITRTWKPGAIAMATAVTTTVTVPGAAVGDIVEAYFNRTLATGLILSAQVTGANTVTITIWNGSSGAVTPSAGTVRVNWWQL